jgi:DNA-binding NarL/FixJ family response regulator
MLRAVALTCLIVDDHLEFLTAARGLLARQGVDVVGVASTGAEAIRMVETLRPDVALVDIYLGPENGFDLARRLVDGADGSRPAVILISTYSEKDFADVIAASPAAGFVAKSDLSATAIHQVLGLTGPA